MKLEMKSITTDTINTKSCKLLSHSDTLEETIASISKKHTHTKMILSYWIKFNYKLLNITRHLHILKKGLNVWELKFKPFFLKIVKDSIQYKPWSDLANIITLTRFWNFILHQFLFFVINVLNYLKLVYL